MRNDHQTRVRVVVLGFGAFLLLLGLAGMFLVSWRRSGGLHLADLLALWPWPIVGLAVGAVAYVVFFYVSRNTIDADGRAPRRRDRFE